MCVQNYHNNRYISALRTACDESVWNLHARFVIATHSLCMESWSWWNEAAFSPRTGCWMRTDKANRTKEGPDACLAAVGGRGGVGRSRVAGRGWGMGGGSHQDSRSSLDCHPALAAPVFLHLACMCAPPSGCAHVAITAWQARGNDFKKEMISFIELKITRRRLWQDSCGNLAMHDQPNGTKSNYAPQ